VKKIKLRDNETVLEDEAARLYRVDVPALRRSLGRNKKRFPGGAVFQLTKSEMTALGLKFVRSRSAPYAFTRFGYIMLANILNSPTAIKAHIRRIRSVCRHLSFEAIIRMIAGQ